MLTPTCCWLLVAAGGCLLVIDAVGFTRAGDDFLHRTEGVTLCGKEFEIVTGLGRADPSTAR